MVNMADPALVVGAWQPVPSEAALLGRAGHSSTVVGSAIFFICGRTGCEPKPSLERVIVTAFASLLSHRSGTHAGCQGCAILCWLVLIGISCSGITAHYLPQKPVCSLHRQQEAVPLGHNELRHRHLAVGPRRASAIQGACIPLRKAGGRGNHRHGRRRQRLLPQ